MRKAAQKRISAIIVTLNEGANLRRTVENLQATLPAESEIIVVDDGSSDRSPDFLTAKDSAARLIRLNQANLAKARNAGASHAAGEILVFADAHIQAPPGWWGPISRLLENPSIGAVAPGISVMDDPGWVGFGQRITGPDLELEWLRRRRKTPYPVSMVAGCFLAMRRGVFQSTGGFDPGMVRWGSEDSEICIRLWLSGYEVWVAPQVTVAHLFREKFPYPVNWTQVVHNKLRMAFLHFAGRRIANVVEALRGYEGFAPALAMAVESDFTARRAHLAARRRRNDDWFFRRFGLQW